MPRLQLTLLLALLLLTAVPTVVSAQGKCNCKCKKDSTKAATECAMNGKEDCKIKKCKIRGRGRPRPRGFKCCGKIRPSSSPTMTPAVTPTTSASASTSPSASASASTSPSTSVTPSTSPSTSPSPSPLSFRVEAKVCTVPGSNRRVLVVTDLSNGDSFAAAKLGKKFAKSYKTCLNNGIADDVFKDYMKFIDDNNCADTTLCNDDPMGNCECNPPLCDSNSFTDDLFDLCGV